MSRPAVAVLLVPLIAFSPVYAQPPSTHTHVAPPTVKGSEHPEKISDQRAWLMRLIAVTSSESDSDLSKQHAAIHRQVSGFDPANDLLDHFRARYDKLTTDYNNHWGNISKEGTSTLQHQAQLQLYRDLDQLVADTVDQLQRKVSPEQWQAINNHLEREKSKMAFSDEKAAKEEDDASFAPAVFHPGDAQLLRTQSITFNYDSQSGYTSYTTLDSDGSSWFQTVYIVGASLNQWGCQWDQYHGQYQPPGCPAVHDFYFVNAINGQGYTTDTFTGEYSPQAYVTLSSSITVPVGPNDGSEASLVNAKVICSVAGLFFGLASLYVKSYVIWGHTFFRYDGQPSVGAFTWPVTPTCTNMNDRPWIVDPQPPAVKWFGLDNWAPPRPPAALSCSGVCVRSLYTGFAWSCPSTGFPFAGICKSLPAPRTAPCTKHP